MKVARTLIAITLSLVFGSSLVLAQVTAPKKTTVKASRAESGKSSKAIAKAPEGPFLVKPYLQLGHTQAAGKVVLMWHAADSRRPLDG